MKLMIFLSNVSATRFWAWACQTKCGKWQWSMQWLVTWGASCTFIVDHILLFFWIQYAN